MTDLRDSPLSDCEIVHTISHQTYSPVTLVGEHHSSTESASLFSHVLATIQPSAIAIESCPDRYSVVNTGDKVRETHGSAIAHQYASANETPLYLIDSSCTSFSNLLTGAPSIESTKSQKPPYPDEQGDISLRRIAEYRDSVRKNNPDKYANFWMEREREMVARLETMRRTISGPVVALVGAGHLSELSHLLRLELTTPFDITDSRVIEASPTSPT